MHIMGVVVQKLELVTVCFSGELRLLRLQARSLRLFACRRLVTGIKVVVNDPDVAGFKRAFEDQVLPEYGAFADRVEIVGYPALWGSGTYPANKGWQTQQALKLLAARTIDKAHYLVLDAKNHFIRCISAADFFAPDGRMRSQLYRIHPPFIPHFKNACRYFGLAELPDLNTGLPTATPFLMQRDITLSLLEEVEEREDGPFQQFFMGRKLVEFYLYYAYLLARHGPIEAFYERRGRISATLFGGMSDDPVRSADTLTQVNNSEVRCMGVHREILKTGNPDIVTMVQQNWRRFGLIDSMAEGHYFAAYHEAKQVPRWRLFF